MSESSTSDIWERMGMSASMVMGSAVGHIGIDAKPSTGVSMGIRAIIA